MSDAKWYVINVKSKSEEDVINRITIAAKSKFGIKECSRIFEEFLIPKIFSEVYKNNEKQEVANNAFPGYLMAKMILNNESLNIVKNTNGVKGFLSSADGQPKVLSDKEYADMSESMRKVRNSGSKEAFALGDVVKIQDGSFKEFEGIITSIDKENAKASVRVEIFGRAMDLDLSLSDIKKVQ